jgi:hypothetical protein
MAFQPTPFSTGPTNPDFADLVLPTYLTGITNLPQQRKVVISTSAAFGPASARADALALVARRPGLIATGLTALRRTPANPGPLARLSRTACRDRAASCGCAINFAQAGHGSRARRKFVAVLSIEIDPSHPAF